MNKSYLYVFLIIILIPFSLGANVSLWYDDFEDNNYIGWSAINSATLAIESGSPINETYSLKVSGTSVSGGRGVGMLYNYTSSDAPLMRIEFSIDENQGGNSLLYITADDNSGFTSQYTFIDQNDGNCGGNYRINYVLCSNISGNNNDPHTFVITWNRLNGLANVTIDGSPQTINYNLSTGGAYDKDNNYFGFKSGHSGSAMNFLIDNIRISNITPDVEVSKNLNIYLKDILTNVSVNTYNISLYNSTGGLLGINETTTGLSYFQINNTGNYTAVLTYANGYSLTNVSNQSVEIISLGGSESLTFYAYKENSVNIFTYETNSGDPITENISVTFISDSVVFINNTFNGTLFLSGITPENYTVIFSSDNYSTTQYLISVTNGSTQTLNAYLLSNPSTSVFTFKDSSNGQNLEGVAVTISRIVGGSWQVVNALTSDISGGVQVQYQPYITYKFNCVRTNYTTKEFTLSPIVFSSYNVYMDRSTDETDATDYAGVMISYSPNVFVNNVNNQISFTFAEPSGDLESYGFNATYGAATVSETGTNAYGEILTNNLSIINAPLLSTVTLEWHYKLTSGSTKYFKANYLVEGASGVGNHTLIHNKNETYGLGILERTTITVGASILVGGVGALFGGPLVGATLGAMIQGIFVKIGFIEIWVVLISLFVLFIMVLWGSSK